MAFLRNLFRRSKPPVSAPGDQDAATVARIIGQANEEMSQSNWKAAAKLISQAMKLDPDNPEAHLYRALCFAQEKAFSRAIDSARRSIQLGLDPPAAAQNVLAHCHYNVGDYQQATLVLTELLENYPRGFGGSSRHDWLDQRGVALCRLGRFQQAQLDLQELYSIVARHSPYGRIAYWLLVSQFEGDEQRARSVLDECSRSGVSLPYGTL